MGRGFTYPKRDIGIQLCEGIPGAIQVPPGMLGTRNVMYQFTHIHLTDKGIGIICQYVRLSNSCETPVCTGEDLTDIYVTTAGGHNKAEEGALAGALFRLRLGIRGVPEFFSRIGLR